MIRRPPRSTLSSSSAASDVYKRQATGHSSLSSCAAGCRERCDIEETTYILIHANDHATSSPSPPSPPSPPGRRLRHPYHFISSGTIRAVCTVSAKSRRQHSPPSVCLFRVACRCSVADARLVTVLLHAAASTSPRRCSYAKTAISGHKDEFLLCRALHLASHQVIHIALG